MSEDRLNLTNADPLVIRRQSTDSNGEFVRFETTVHPSPNADGPAVDLNHERYLIDNPDEHIHPHQTEVIEVLAGAYAVEIEGTEHRLQAGEEITVPKDTAHRHWNPSAEPSRVAHEHHPAMDSAEHIEAMWALAQQGKTDEKGIPNPLRFAVVNRAYPGVAYTTAIPVPIQKALFRLLAPIGRLLGYRAAPSAGK